MTDSHTASQVDRLDGLIARLRRDGACLRASAGPEAIAAEAARLGKCLGIALPADCHTFLGLCDGLGWNGLYLYGVEPWRVDDSEDDASTYPGLLTANTRRREYKGLEGILLLGEVDDDFLAYDETGTTYTALDRVSLDRLETYSSLADLLEATVAGLQGSDREA
jgi:hypothetical protein